jgi:hypothetical protein
MPAELYDFRAASGMGSFAEELNHVAVVNTRLCRLATSDSACVSRVTPDTLSAVGRSGSTRWAPGSSFRRRRLPVLSSTISITTFRPPPIGEGFQRTFCGSRYQGYVNGHTGCDWPMPTGTPLHAAAGRVEFAGREPAFPCVSLGSGIRSHRSDSPYRRRSGSCAGVRPICTNWRLPAGTR